MEIKKSTLTFAEMYQFINNVVDACFEQDEQGNDISYSPMMKDVSIQANFCEFYTTMEFGEDFDENFESYMSVDIDINISLGLINKIQWNAIVSAINEAIDFRKQKLIHKSPLDELLSTINTIVMKYDNGLNMDEISTLLPKLANLGNFDEENVIKTIIKNMPQGKKKQSKSKSKKVVDQTPTDKVEE